MSGTEPVGVEARSPDLALFSLSLEDRRTGWPEKEIRDIE